MTEYHKIQSLFKRSEDGRKMLFGEHSLPEFEYLKDCKWTFTEKVDGTNIRVVIKDGEIRFGGKTNAAAIPAKLLERLQDRFLNRKDIVLGAIADAVLYGEGFGAGIQKGGGNYIKHQDFVLFDVYCGGLWLQRPDVQDIGDKLGVPVVPVLGTGTLGRMQAMVLDNLLSTWGPFRAEGLVARPEVEIQTRRGHRIITKLKFRDFPA